jgi:hypothetical protein
MIWCKASWDPESWHPYWTHTLWLPTPVGAIVLLQVMLYGLQAIGNNTPTTPQFNYIHQGLAYSGSMGECPFILGQQEESQLDAQGISGLECIPYSVIPWSSTGARHHDNQPLKRFNLGMHR